MGLNPDLRKERTGRQFPTTTSLTMSSREIAELTGKDHDNIRRDIKLMADALSLSFEEKVEPSTGGRPSKVFALPKRESLILVSGYSVQLRARIVDRWMELEAQASVPAIPRTFAAALRLAAETQERLEAATAELWEIASQLVDLAGIQHQAGASPSSKHRP